MLHHDGYEFHELQRIQIRYIGTINITQRAVNWTADMTQNDQPRGSLKGSLLGIGDDEGPVRRAVDIAVKAAIQSTDLSAK
jgi:hypothetical protein